MNETQIFLIGIIFLLIFLWIAPNSKDPMGIVTKDMSKEEKEFTQRISRQMAKARDEGVIMLRPAFNPAEPLTPDD